MDPANILPSLERLDDAVDNLEEALQPLVNNMADVASKLPLLDKAKFYVLMTYSIESMLFCETHMNDDHVTSQANTVSQLPFVLMEWMQRNMLFLRN